MDGGGAGGADVLHPCGGFKAEGRIGLHHQRCGEVLLHETAVEVANDHRIHVFRLQTRVGQCGHGDLADHAFHIVIALAKGHMRPADHAFAH